MQIFLRLIYKETNIALNFAWHDQIVRSASPLKFQLWACVYVCPSKQES